MKAQIKSLFYNFIFLLLIAFLTVPLLQGKLAIECVALDQKVRCGMTEHEHTDRCYNGEILLCTAKAHCHSNNCYLLLLADNDVDWLLQTVETMKERSLENVLNSSLSQALTMNPAFSDETPPLELTGQDISSLNDTIENNQIQPSVVLNENLLGGQTLNYTPYSEQDIALTDVGGDPQSGSRAINFYMLLDGQITFVNSGTLISSNPEYYSYANTAAAYTGVVTTELTASNIGSTYFFTYNTTGNTDTSTAFATAASYRNNTVRFANSSNAQYALLCTRVRSSWSYVYEPVPFYTVALDYSQADGRAMEKEYVQSGLASSLILSDAFFWYDENGTPVDALPATITETTVLYAKPRQFTATFLDRNGTQVAEPYSAMPTNGSVQVSLPSLSGTQWDGWIWITEGSDGTSWYPGDGSAAVLITQDTCFRAIPGSYTLTFIDENGNTTTQEVAYRENITLDSLPDGWFWTDSSYIKYLSGQAVGPITTDMVFTATERTIAVHYNVNFPSSAVDLVDSVPTIYGTDTSTVTDYTSSGKALTARRLSSRTARREISSDNKESQTYFFQGWTVENTDLLIPPDNTIPWQTLVTYADEDGTVNLQGVWEAGARLNSATFFVRFDSAAVDTEGNITSQPSTNYTPEVFNTHVGGVEAGLTDQVLKDTYEIADTSSDNSYSADQAIRTLYGERAQGLWLYDFPSDDHVFAYLKDYLANNPDRQLTVDGEVVDPQELDHNYYAIRWYVFKLEGTTWHIDGKLLKKEGTITVDKLFGGDDAVLQAEKDTFYILAENGTLDAQGNFAPYDPSHSHFKQHLLVVNQNGADLLHSSYPNAQIQLFDSETDSAHYYQWLIPEVLLDEYWHIEEFPVLIPGYSCYAEYSVYDTDGSFSAIAQYGTRASVIGKTFALDEDPDQGLMVEFRNYYYPEESILIKKEDVKTGKPIGGAVFELWQNDNLLTFNYDSATKQYIRDASGNGEFSRIVTSDDGFSVISTTGFSYEYGDVVVKEVQPPAGYDPAPEITVGLNENGNVVVKNIENTQPDQWSTIANIPTGDVLVVKDHTAEYISVTAEKIWNTTTPADSVQVVLQANGQNAAALFPGMTNAQVTLSEANGWRHIWTDLPRYANGDPVTWSIKETVIGDKPTMSDGVTFANWTVTYSPGVGTDADGDGDIDSWLFTVTNSVKRLQMILTKIGTDGSLLPGSTFTLEQVTLENGQWVPVANMLTDTQTTDRNGMLTFDNLIADVYYRLSETSASDGYFAGFAPVILTMDGSGYICKVLPDGSFAQLNDPFVQLTRPYNIQVINVKITPLPETGGMGAYVYTYSGALLMLAAAAVCLYKNKRKKAVSDTS